MPCPAMPHLRSNKYIVHRLNILIMKRITLAAFATILIAASCSKQDAPVPGPAAGPATYGSQPATKNIKDSLAKKNPYEDRAPWRPDELM